MARRRTYYDILQVMDGADPKVITTVYRTLMGRLKKHPDLGGDEREAQLINEAYGVLSDPVKRARYDASLGISSDRPGKEPVKKEVFCERRRVPRRPSKATVSFCIGHNAQWQTARVKDYSTLGIRLHSHEPFLAGEHVVIAPSNIAATAFHGTVKWSRMFHPSVLVRVYEAGIEFSDRISDIEQRLEI